jgi:hypothetical protein
MGLVAAAVDRWLGRAWAGETIVLQTLRLAATIGAALIALAASAWALRIREFSEAAAVLARRVRRRR